MRIYYPDDDDGDALRRVAEHGADMSRPMKIEFSINVPDVERAHSLAEGIAAQGYIPDIFVDDESGSVSIYCAKTMLATHEGVVAAQSELNELCVQFGAECDDWITAGNQQDQVEKNS
jgi:Regulator of ribonuclease activity B